MGREGEQQRARQEVRKELGKRGRVGRGREKGKERRWEGDRGEEGGHEGEKGKEGGRG